MNEDDPQVNVLDPKVDEPTAQEAIDRITARGEQIRRVELETALAQLQAHGDLSADQQAAVEHLATSIVEELLAVPSTAIDRAPADDESLAVSLRLFAPE